MFVLFVDIDGVLVDWETIASDDYKIAHDLFKVECVDALNMFAKIPDCKIVVSSAWRIGRRVSDLQNLFLQNGVVIPVIDKTTSGKLDADRGHEIKWWIRDNKYTGEFLVIDDEVTDIINHVPRNNILHIPNGLQTGGLTEEIAKKAIDQILTKRRTKMCSAQTMDAIETVVGELTRMRKSFTGKDVYDRMHSKYVRRSQDFSACPEGPSEISRDVRRLFNSKHPVFKDYGSALVYHDDGPVLFFALPYHAKIKARKIEQKLG